VIGNSRSPLGRRATGAGQLASWGPRDRVGKKGSSTTWEGLQELWSSCQPLCNVVGAAGSHKQLLGQLLGKALGSQRLLPGSSFRQSTSQLSLRHASSTPTPLCCPTWLVAEHHIHRAGAHVAGTTQLHWCLRAPAHYWALPWQHLGTRAARWNGTQAWGATQH
jgi:hypothetical protein